MSLTSNSTYSMSHVQRGRSRSLLGQLTRGLFYASEVNFGVHQEEQQLGMGVRVRIRSVPRGFQDPSNSLLPSGARLWVWVGELAPGPLRLSLPAPCPLRGPLSHHAVPQKASTPGSVSGLVSPHVKSTKVQSQLVLPNPCPSWENSSALVSAMKNYIY